MPADNKLDKYIVCLDTSINTAYVNHKYIDLYTAYQSVYFNKVMAALNYFEDIQPPECALLLCSYQLRANYSGMDFIEDILFLYKQQNKPISFKVLMYYDKFKPKINTKLSGFIFIKQKPLMRHELIQYLEEIKP